MLEQAKGKPEELLIHRMTLRSFKQARYTAENGKHFGLAATYYCHFTSPIRRYPDLQIHRIISQYLTGELTDKRISKYNRTLAQVALQCSINERKAEDAERETDKYKIVEYMQDKIGETFDGIISGVTSWGIYVELENTVEVWYQLMICMMITISMMKIVCHIWESILIRHILLAIR